MGAVRNIAFEICGRDKKSNSNTILILQRETIIIRMILDTTISATAEITAELNEKLRVSWPNFIHLTWQEKCFFLTIHQSSHFLSFSLYTSIFFLLVLCLHFLPSLYIHITTSVSFTSRQCQ